MSQIFPAWTNTLSKYSILGGLLLLVLLLGLGWALQRSSYTTQADVYRMQPVPFSHRHHVSGLGIDCRYCHTSVEVSGFAGMPPTKTCMTCHSQIWSQSPMLEPVRDSFKNNIPIHWNRVYSLPDYVYFNHSIHVAKGVGCTTCHGPINQMPLTYKANPFYMKDCLECHRFPEKYIRPKEKVFDVNWTPPPNQVELGKTLVEKYNIHKGRITDCSTCHR